MEELSKHSLSISANPSAIPIERHRSSIDENQTNSLHRHDGDRQNRTNLSISMSHPPLSNQEDDGEDVPPQVKLSSGPSTISEEINAKFAELQDLVHQHDRGMKQMLEAHQNNMKQMLKAHQNSVKQSVKAQLEKLQADLRRHIDDASQKQDVMLPTFTTGFGQELDPGQSESNPSA